MDVPHERYRRDDFAQGNGMYPDSRRGNSGIGAIPWIPSQALRNASPTSFFREKNEQNNRGREDQKYVVKEVCHGASGLVSRYPLFGTHKRKSTIYSPQSTIND
jgi:hypothetical protein